MTRLVCDFLSLYNLLLLIRVLSSWFPQPHSGPLRTAWNGLYAVTDPVLRPLRGIIPPVRAGGMGFDMSPMIAFIVIFILIGAICR
jgi:YggT family protein